MNNTRAIYQFFDEDKTLLKFPYPPVYKEVDTDYICFSTNRDVISKYWKMIYVTGYSEDIINTYLNTYANLKFIETNQIQVAPLFDENFTAYPALITVPGFSELPEAEFDVDKLVPTCDGNGSYIYKKNPIYTGGQYDGRPLLLTIGVPVSNQKDTIDRCLLHIKPLLDELDSELVVVDTGSTDGTIDICREYGARIVEFPWCNNMSAARNMAVYNAKGAWYMSIDDDEWFEDVDDILEFFKSGRYLKYQAATYIQHNLLSSEANTYLDVPALRLAKITPELHFEGRIHDGLVVSKSSVVNGDSLSSLAHHHGFCKDDTIKVYNKYKRNIASLLYDVYEYPASLRYNYQLANELHVVSHFDQSAAYFFRGLSMELEKGITFNSNLSAAALISTAHNRHSEDVFYLTDLLGPKYSFTIAERAFFSYVRAEVGLYREHDALEILSDYNKYIEYRMLYDKDPKGSRANTYTGLCYCTSDTHINAAYTIPFCAYMMLGMEQEALRELDIVKATTAVEGTHPFWKYIHAGSGEAFARRLERLSREQREERAELYLDGFIKYVTMDESTGLELMKLARILSCFNLTRLQLVLATRGRGIAGEFWDKLGSQDNIKLFEQGISLQMQYLYAYMLKHRYLNLEDENINIDAFLKFIIETAKFVRMYYNPMLLECMPDSSIPSEQQMAYLVWRGCNGTDVLSMIKDLKAAFELYPEFNQEIKLLISIFKE